MRIWKIITEKSSNYGKDDKGYNLAAENFADLVDDLNDKKVLFEDIREIKLLAETGSYAR